MSVKRKNWKIRNKNLTLSLKEKLFQNRDLMTEEAVSTFLDVKETGGLHDPFLLKDMGASVERISRAISNQEKIIIFGDYDVDGITGCAVLIRVLNRLGANVSYRIPHRVDDGYGLNEKFVGEFVRIGVKLVITVDCGISCRKEIDIATKAGIDVIVTDHHTVPNEMPQALAIVHPLQKDCPYPFKGLTGAAVAFKLCQALIVRFLPKEEQLSMIDSLLDLTSLGVVADCGPLTGENRYIVKRGLEILANTKWEGLQLLLEKSGLKDGRALDTTAVGFKIAPRINAAGRVGTPYSALQLLLHDSRDGKAAELADKLEELNRLRQKMLEQALLEAHANLDCEKELIIIGWNSAWHVGILGLISGRLAQEHGRPAMIMQDLGGRLVGSARSNEYFNIIEALTHHSDLLVNFGGHEQAAGFEIKKENLEPFVLKIREYSRKKLDGVDLRPSLNLDCEMEWKDVNWETMRFLETLGPFGVSNEEPVFLLSSVEVESVRQVGSDNRHLSLSLKLPGGRVKGIGFRMGEFADYVRKQGKIDIACHLQKNNWNGEEDIQLHVVDLR